MWHLDKDVLFQIMENFSSFFLKKNKKKMWSLNNDVLFLIFKELKDDKKSLYSCLLVNRTWCITAVPILWKNPETYDELLSMNKLFNVILLNLSEDSRDILKNLGINNPLTEKYKPPLFNYTNFLKYLDL